MQGVIASPCLQPLVAFRPPLRARAHDHLKSAPTLSFPLKTTFPCLKIKDRPLHVSAISTPLVLDTHKNDFLFNIPLQSAEKRRPSPLNASKGGLFDFPSFPRMTKKPEFLFNIPLQSAEIRGPSPLNASKGGLFDFPPFPRMTKKPEWWWRTLACLLYLMTLHDHQYWTYAHPTNNPPPFLENFDSFMFPLLSAIFSLPRLLVSTYPFLSWVSIVRQKHWPHFLRVHVMTAILIGAIVQSIGVASGWFPSWFFPPHFWSAATFIYLVTVVQCILCALGGMYPDVPFVRDAAYLHADLR